MHVEIGTDERKKHTHTHAYTHTHAHALDWLCCTWRLLCAAEKLPFIILGKVDADKLASFLQLNGTM